MPATTRRDAEGRTILGTLAQEHIPPPMPMKYLESDGEWLKPGSGDIKVSTQPSRGRVSDAPNFQMTRMVDAPSINRKTGDITMRPTMQHMLDPEKHIEQTSRAPGANEMHGPFERQNATYTPGAYVPAYGGTTDARPGIAEHQSTRSVWRQKIRDVRQKKGAREVIQHPVTGEVSRNTAGEAITGRVHGAGIYDALMSGESVRSPVHLIVDPAEPFYGPHPFHTTGGSVDFHDEDAGGFGHDQPVQWEGHHRVAAAAEKQRELRESGAADWSVPVPYEMHFGTQMAMANKPGILARERTTELVHTRRQRLRNMLMGVQDGRRT